MRGVGRINRRLGMYCSSAAAFCTLLFFLGLFTRNDLINYSSCLVLSWVYVLTGCAFASYAEKSRQALAFGGVAIAVIYSVFTNLVYYSQLTTVAYETADQAVLDALSFTSGSWLFGFDIMGYGLMGLSTLLIGLSIKIETGKERVVKAMLIGHGIFFPICVIAPALNLFQPGSDDGGGILALQFWCLYFAPLMILSARYFYQLSK